MKKYKAKIRFPYEGKTLNLIFKETRLKNSDNKTLFANDKNNLMYTEYSLINYFNAKRC